MFSRDFVVLRRRKKKGPLTLMCFASVDTDLVPVDNSVVRYVWYCVWLFRNFERKKGCYWNLYYSWEQEGSIGYFCKLLWFQTGSNIMELCENYWMPCLKKINYFLTKGLISINIIIQHSKLKSQSPGTKIVKFLGINKK